MKKRFLLSSKVIALTMLLLFMVSFAHAVTITITANTNWSAIATGSGPGGQPSSTDIIIINNQAILTVNVSNGVCASITLGGAGSNNNGELTFNASSQVTVGGIVTFAAHGNKINTITMTAGGKLICQGFTVEASVGNQSFIAGTGTVELTANNVLPTIIAGVTGFSTFNNLIISGGTTTFSASTTIGANLSIGIGAVVNLGTITSHSANTLTLGGSGQTNGSWGGTGSGASHINATYFAAATGILNVTVASAKTTITSGDWNTSFLWSPPGVPTSTDDVFIQNSISVGTNPPATPAQCRYMTINTGGSIYISSGNALTVNGTLTNNVGAAALSIQDNGSLIYTAGTPAGSAVRNVTKANYHFLSSPVTSTTFNSVFPINQTLIWAQVYNEPSGLWQNQTNASSLTPGVGYSVWVDPTLADQTANFSGTFNSDGVTRTLSRVNVSGNPNLVGWNLLGNPYTSAIDWDNGGWHSNTGASVAIWNGGTSGNYIYWNGSAGSLVNGVIPAQSGFFVLANANGLPITIPYAARVHSAIPLYKETVPNTLHLGIAGNTVNSYRDDTYIQFTPDATSDFDSQYDAYKLWGMKEAPQLYSIIPGNVLSINVLPSVTANPVVNIGLKVGMNATYTITADGMESFDLTVPIRLDDLKLGISNDLRLNPVYSFTADTSDAENRFLLRFQSATGVDEPSAARIFVYGQQGHIIVNNTENYDGTIYVYNTAGQAISTLTMQPGIQTLNQLPAGMYIVKVVTGKTIISRKVVLF